jgi:aryl-alcohol dehydrogenase-like predicted oxidoreductase
MEMTNLGRTGLKVSRFCLGTMNFGPMTGESDSFAIMDKALEIGINFFDTANVYGGRSGKGATEDIVGRWLGQGNRRDRIVLATKVYGRMGESPNDARLSAYHIRRACEESLRRLKTDHLDLYQMHHIDRETPWEEIWQAMDLLVSQGKVLYVGSSNFAGWHLARANAEAEKRHSLGLVSEQGLYNLASRMAELEVLPACRALGLAFLAWSPLHGGALAGALQKVNEGRRATEMVRDRVERYRSSLEPFEALCRELGENPSDVALSWLFAQEGISAAIIGPRTVAQLTESLHALDLTLDPETLGRLDEICPGPGGPAPEAYAW